MDAEERRLRWLNNYPLVFESVGVAIYKE